MAILKYQAYADPLTDGQVSTLELSNNLSYGAEAAIDFGRALFSGVNDVTARPAKQTQATLVYDADFVVSNTIHVNITGGDGLDGTFSATVPFSTDQATTLANLISAIDGANNFSAEPVAGNPRAILITLREDIVDNLFVSSYVSGGASQANATVTFGTERRFVGIARKRYGQPLQIGGVDRYQVGDAVNATNKGTIAVRVVTAVTPDDTVYVYNDQANSSAQGMFTNDSANAIEVTSAKFKTSATGTLNDPVLVEVTINQP